MQLLKMQNISEHLACSNYEGGNRPSIEIKRLEPNMKWELVFHHNIAVFVVEGSVEMTFYKYKNSLVTQGRFFVINSGGRSTFLAREKLLLICVRLDDKLKLCECYPMEQLYKEQNAESSMAEEEIQLQSAEINQALWPFLTGLMAHVKNGLKCKYFFETKSKELLYLLRGYYTKAELRRVLQLILSNDTRFSEQVKANAHKYKTATELADSMHYTLSGFNKKFKVVFGMPAYQWMLDQKKELIYSELRTGSKSLKELSFDMGFCSPSNFSSFCKRYFSQTPGEIRNRIEYLNPEE